MRFPRVMNSLEDTAARIVRQATSWEMLLRYPHLIQHLYPEIFYQKSVRKMRLNIL